MTAKTVKDTRATIKDENALKAFDASVSGAKVEFAKSIKGNKNFIASLLGVGEDKLNDQAIATMAEGWVEENQFIIDGKKFDKQTVQGLVKNKSKELAKLETQFPELSKAFVKNSGISDEQLEALKKNPESLLPTSETFAKVAGTVSESVQGQDSFFSKIWHMISGFISWIADGFGQGGKKSISEYIYASAGESAAANATAALEQEKAKDPSLRVLLTRDKLDALHTRVLEGVKAAGRGTDTAAKPSVTEELSKFEPKNIKIGDFALDENMVKREATAFIAKEIRAGIAEKSVIGNALISTDVTNTLAASVTEGAVNALKKLPDAAKTDKEELKKHLTKSILAEVEKDKAKWMPNSFTTTVLWIDADKMVKENITTKVGELVDKNFDKIQPHLNQVTDAVKQFKGVDMLVEKTHQFPSQDAGKAGGFNLNPRAVGGVKTSAMEAQV